MARSDAQDALAVLRRSATSGAFLDTPDLLVSIDTRAKEIVAVQAFGAASAPSHSLRSRASAAWCQMAMP